MEREGYVCIYIYVFIWIGRRRPYIELGMYRQIGG